jgi:hypothetical protein
MPDNDTTDRLAEARALADAATPGPWIYEPPEAIDAAGMHYVSTEYAPADDDPPLASFFDEPTARFVAASRQLVPELADELEQARAHLSIRDQQHHHLVGEYDKLLAELVKTRAERDDANADAVAFLDTNENMGTALVEAREERDRARATAVALEQENADLHREGNCLAAEVDDLRTKLDAAVEAHGVWARTAQDQLAEVKAELEHERGLSRRLASEGTVMATAIQKVRDLNPTAGPESCSTYGLGIQDGWDKALAAVARALDGEVPDVDSE